MYNEHIDKITERTNFTSYSVKDAIIDYLVVECVMNIHDEDKRKQMIRIVESYLANSEWKAIEDKGLMLEMVDKISIVEMMALKQMRERGIIDEMFYISKEWKERYDV